VSAILTRSGGFEGIGFAATSNVAAQLLTERGSTYFGVEAMLLPYELARILNVPQESGWLVQHVVQNSPAGKLGIQGGFRTAVINDMEIMLGGDIILQVDHLKITDAESIIKVWEYFNSNHSTTTYNLKVLRAGEIKDIRWVSSQFQPGRR